MSTVTTKHVSKRFGDVTVLRDINLDVAEGDFVTLLGPSGCGKTTLLRIIAGLETPDSGTIHAGENCFVDMTRGYVATPQDRKLGFVFQDYGLWPHLTVAENVAFPLKMAKATPGLIAERVGEVLADVRLQDHADKLPEQLSGGQKQRVSIARALSGRPKLILFDEPLSNLDANLREELGQEIRLLSKQLGLTCINVTHDRREAQILSDYIALMKDGVFHQYGRPDVLFRNPRDVWAAQFLDAGNILPARDVLSGSDLATDALALVPRGALEISTDKATLDGTVLNAIYIEDRYEVTVIVGERHVKLFADQTVQIMEPISLLVDEASVTVFNP